jgi:alanine racemase
MERFHSVCREAEERGIDLVFKHAASSSGIQTTAAYYLDMVRPGIVLYGCYPSDKIQKEAPLDLRPVLQLKSRVAAVKMLEPGDSVSYCRAYVAEKREKFAVISIGYSDGYPVKAVNKGFALIRGERHPIIARVTANHIEVLLDLDSPVEVGDEAVLIGSQGAETISAVDVAHWGGVTVYQLLARLSPYLPRKVV